MHCGATDLSFNLVAGPTHISLAAWHEQVTHTCGVIIFAPQYSLKHACVYELGSYIGFREEQK
jgi:hypothetical protein